MRQTPFGVWNPRQILRFPQRGQTAMRQTPFGVWNQDTYSWDGRVTRHCNEADAFWRLERVVRAVHNLG